MVLRALERSALFMSGAAARHGLSAAVQQVRSGHDLRRACRQCDPADPGTPRRIRTDVSATLFLNAPEDYDGGELIVQDTYGTHSVKLPAGDMILYPATSLHRVAPVTRGARIASFFWVQSMVKDDAERSHAVRPRPLDPGAGADRAGQRDGAAADGALSQPGAQMGRAG